MNAAAAPGRGAGAKAKDAGKRAADSAQDAGQQALDAGQAAAGLCRRRPNRQKGRSRDAGSGALNECSMSSGSDSALGRRVCATVTFHPLTRGRFHVMSVRPVCTH